MTLKELMANLSYEELSNLAWAENSGTIDAEYQPKIVRYANEALRRLHSRFILKTDDVLIAMYEHITNYHLLPRFALTHTPVEEEYLYILDTPLEPFTDTAIKILEVFDSFGRQLPLNDADQVWSVFTPQPKILQVPRPMNWQSLAVTYQKGHELLEVDKPDQPIEIPECLEGALTAYIAYKVYSHMNTDGSTGKAQEHLSIYDNICTEVQDQDLVNTAVSNTRTTFYERGWR